MPVSPRVPVPGELSRARRHLRRAAVATILCLAAAACGNDSSPSSSGSQPTTKVRLVLSPGSFNASLFYVARDLGFMKTHGVDLQITNSTVTPFVPLEGGSADVGVGTMAVTLTTTIKQGFKVKVIGVVQRSTVGQLVAHTGSGLQPNLPWPEAITQLKGKTVAVSVLGGGNDQFLQGLIGAAGLQPTDVRRVAAGSVPAIVATLGSGNVDAALAPQPQAAQIVDGGTGFTFFKLGNTDPNADPKLAGALLTGANGVFMKPEYVSAHPDVAKNFMLAIQDASTWVQDPSHKAQLVQVFKKSILAGKGDDKQLTDALADYPALVKNVCFTQKDLDDTTAVLLGAGLIKGTKADIDNLGLIDSASEPSGCAA
jgi:ABC-type nitrate/sulfonate/bicarbonate transport system substrate-binding protein